MFPDFKAAAWSLPVTGLFRAAMSSYEAAVVQNKPIAGYRLLIYYKKVEFIARYGLAEE